MRKIVVVGSCNTNMVIKSEKLPMPGDNRIAVRREGVLWLKKTNFLSVL